MSHLIENKFGHGAKPQPRLARFIRKTWKRARGQVLGSGMGFDWNTGFDVRDIIGPIAIKNQGTNFSCSGQAGSYFLEIQRRLQEIKEGAISAKSIYAPIAAPGGGATISDLNMQISTRGANLEATVPSVNQDGSPLPEVMMIDTSFENKGSIAAALLRAGYVPFDCQDDIDSVAVNIQQNGAVIMMIRGKNNGTWLSPNPQPPTSDNPNPYFYHYMCLIGAKMINGKKTIIALQSLGEETGDHGIQYFDEGYWNSGNIIDCFTYIFAKNIKPLPTNHSIFAAVISWFRKLFGFQ